MPRDQTQRKTARSGRERSTSSRPVFPVTGTSSSTLTLGASMGRSPRRNLMASPRGRLVALQAEATAREFERGRRRSPGRQPLATAPVGTLA
jgi:hypothetical protein